MAEHPNVERIRRVYEGAARTDPAPFIEALDPDVVWHFAGRSWMAGDHRGLPDVGQLFMNIAALSGGTFKTDPVDILGNDERVVSVVNASAARNGHTVDTSVCVVWTFKDGKVVDAREHIYDLYAVDDLWGDTRPG